MKLIFYFFFFFFLFFFGLGGGGGNDDLISIRNSPLAMRNLGIRSTFQSLPLLNLSSGIFIPFMEKNYKRKMVKSVHIIMSKILMQNHCKSTIQIHQIYSKLFVIQWSFNFKIYTRQCILDTIDIEIWRITSLLYVKEVNNHCHFIEQT